MCIRDRPTIVLAILKAADTGGNFWIIIASALAVFLIVQAIQDGFIVPRVLSLIHIYMCIRDS